MQDDELLCKHVHKWQMGNGFVANFHFIKDNVEKHLTSSTLPTIYTMVNYFTYFKRKLQKNAEDVAIATF